MTIYEQLIAACDGLEGKILTTADVKRSLQTAYGTNPSSVIPSDYCYNRFNNGLLIDRHKPLFIYLKTGFYRYVGNAYSYTGPVAAKPKGKKNDQTIGEFKQGELFLFDSEH